MRILENPEGRAIADRVRAREESATLTQELREQAPAAPLAAERISTSS